jgi:hypothetical protein
MASNDLEQDKIDHFQYMNKYGDQSWCAARTKCRNNLEEATDDVGCSKCNLFVHSEECTLENIQEEGENNENRSIICKWCETSDPFFENSIEMVPPNDTNSGNTREGNANNHFIDIEMADPTVTENCDTEQGSCVSNTGTQNRSFSVTAADKISILHKIETEKVITKDSADKYIQALANISNTKFDMAKAETVALRRMFGEFVKS